jgi:hypothetical protein
VPPPLAVCTLYALPDAYATVVAESPYATASCVPAGSACANKMALVITIAHHLWHSLAYALKPIDLIHHVPGISICVFSLPFAWGPVLNLATLFLMGIPGGIDYALLTAIKLKALHPRVEKDINQSLNVWIRCPGAHASAFIMFGAALLHPTIFSGNAHRLVVFLSGVHHYWNGAFFMYRTVDARTRYIQASKDKEKAK